MLDANSRPVRAVSTFSLAILLSTAVTAQPGPDRGSDRIAVTAAECARLGFDWDDADAAGMPLIGGAPMQMPSPAPAAVPAMEQAADAARIAAPPPPPQPQVITERYPDATPNPVHSAATEPLSTFSIDVDTASYANVRRFLNENNLPPADAVRIEELVNYFDYDYAIPTSAAEPFATTIAVTPSPWSDGREIIHIGLQGYEIEQAEQPPLNLSFLIDVSGSMWSPDRLPLAQEAMNILVGQLRPEDRVSIVVYAGAAGAVLEPTAGDQKLTIRCAIGSLRAGGSTAGGAGLALAYDLAEQNYDDDAVNRVVLLTDGDFNVGVTSEQSLEDFVVRQRDTGIYLSVYGFGRGNYNDLMMQTLSQAGNGTAAYIDTLQEARRLFRDDFSSSFFPIADDVKIQVEFNPAVIAEYRLIGYETRLLDAADFNNDAVDAGEVSSGASVTALYEVTPVGGPLAIEPLRYQTPAAADLEAVADELAYLSIRYQPPGGGESILIERPITDGDRVETVADAPESTRWALAVAAFGQYLRNDPYLQNGYGLRDIVELAQGARGDDPFGIRAEFVQLVRAAEAARSINQ